MNDEEHTSGDSHQHDNHTHSDSLSNSELNDMLQDQVHHHHDDPANEHHHHDDQDNQDEEVDEDGNAKDPHMMGGMGYMPQNFYPPNMLRPQVPFHMMATPNMFIPTVPFSPTRAGGPMHMGKQLQPYPYGVPHQQFLLNAIPYGMQPPMSFPPTPDHGHSPQTPTSESKTPKKSRARSKSSASTSASGGSGKQKKKHRQRAVRHNWTQEQDEKLINAINSKQYSENGEKIRWTKISQEVFNSKLTPQSVYQRYMRVLNPKLNTKEWTHTEDETLTTLYKQHGDQWALIAKKLNGMKADVWIRQRAVRLGLIPDGSVKTPGSSPGPESKKRKRATRKGDQKFPSDHSDMELNKSLNGDDEMRMSQNSLALNTPKKPRKGNHPIKGYNPENRVFIQDPSAIALDKMPFRRRNLNKSARKPDKKYKSLEELYLAQPETQKYISISVPHSSIFANFAQQDEDETRVDCNVELLFGSKSENIRIASYRTHVAAAKGTDFSDRELLVQFPFNINSIFYASQDKLSESEKKLEKKLFVDVTIRQAKASAKEEQSASEMEDSFDKYAYGEKLGTTYSLTGFQEGTYALPLQSGSSLQVGISYASELFQEDTDVFEFSNVALKYLPNFLQERVLVFTVLKPDRYGEPAQFTNLQWDLNCPLCKHVVEESTVDSLMQHLTNEHSSQFKFELSNSAPSTIHAIQLKDAPPLANPNRRRVDMHDIDLDDEQDAKRRRYDIQIDNDVAMPDMMGQYDDNVFAQYLNFILMTDVPRVGPFGDQWNQFIFESMKNGMMKAHADFPAVVRSFLEEYKETLLEKSNNDALAEHLAGLQSKGMISPDDYNSLKAMFPTPQKYQGMMEGAYSTHQLMTHPGHPMHQQYMPQFHFMNNPSHLQLQQFEAMRQGYPGAQGIHALQHEYQASQSADQSQSEYANDIMLYTASMQEEDEDDEESRE